VLWQYVYLYLLFFVLFVLCFLYCFVYVYLFLFVLSVLTQGLLPPSDNSIAVNNNNKDHCLLKCNTMQSGTQVPTGRKNFLLPSTS
jgi:hypothetical protein